MIETRFERIVMDGFFRLGSDIDIRGLIKNYAAAGYRFCGMVPAVIEGHGIIMEMELVFQKEE